MPIYTPDNTFMHRILNGDIEVKRVYEGDTLAWGLYEIIYHNKDENTSDYKPNRYVWGLKYNLYQLETDEFDEYLMHCDGWYEDKLFVTAIPYITKDFHKDLELFAKWRRRKYSYGGTIVWYKWEGGGGGGVGIRDEPPTPSDSTYPWDNSPFIWMPNCTWYAKWRALEAGAGSTPVVNQPEAKNWNISSNLGANWVYISGTSGWGPGDVLYFGSNNHVCFVEGDGEISESVYTEYLYDWTEIPRDSTPRATYNWMTNHWEDRCRSMSGKAGGLLKNRYWHKGSDSMWFEISTYLVGYLHYTGSWSGGGGSWDDEPYTVPKTECTDQEYPSFPNADDIKKGDTNPQGEYRPSVWSTRSGDSTWQVYYTDTSYYNYDTNQWSEWTNEATQNSKTDPSAHFLMDWD